MSGALVLVTGATGFIGRHTVHALVQRGYRVRALCRTADRELAAAGAEVVRGDVLVRDSVDQATKGAAIVVHGAGLVSREAADGSLMMRLHVNGTRNVMEAAVAHDVKRVVHLSTSGVVAVGDDASIVYHEDDPVPFDQLARFPYYLSKWLAERVADDVLRLSSSKLQLVTLNPSLALGPGDVRGSSTTDIKRFLDRQLPITPTGGFSFVDARDVATTVVAAIEQGRPNERYLLGALNLTFAEFFARLETVSGVKGPPLSMPLPRGLATFSIGLLERVAGVVGAKLPVTMTEAEMASAFWYVDARKAQRALGFAPRDPMVTLLDTVRDLRGQYVERRERLVAPSSPAPRLA